MSPLLRYRHVDTAQRQQIKAFAVLVDDRVHALSGVLFYRDVHIQRHHRSAAHAAGDRRSDRLVATNHHRLFHVALPLVGHRRRHPQEAGLAALTALLALVYFGSIIFLQRLVGALTGAAQSPLAVVVSTLGIAALFTPLRRRIQDAIDRRFFRKKYDAQQVLAQFAVTARDETDLDALTAELVRVVQETMQPESVSVWLRKQEAPKSALASSGPTEPRS